MHIHSIERQFLKQSFVTQSNGHINCEIDNMIDIWKGSIAKVLTKAPSDMREL